MVRDFLIAFPLVNTILVSVSLAVGISITPAHILFSFLPCLAISFFWNNWPNSGTFFFVIILLAILFITAISSSIILIDVYGDSRSYHGPAVIALADGWNPYYNWKICRWDDDYCIQTSKFIDHYPKAQWYISAEFYSLFRNLDVGKSMNVLMLFLCFLVAYEIAASLLPKQRIIGLAVAICVALNPVAVAQLFSGTVDGILSSAISIIVLLLVNFLFTREKRHFHKAMFMTVYFVNLKYTGLIYALILVFLIVTISSLWKRKFQKQIAVSGFSTIFFSVFVIGFNPYVTNLLTEKNPFALAIDVASGSSVIDLQADPEFISKNRFEKFLIATFSVGKESKPKEPELTVPLSRWKLNRGIAVRFSGFGPLFSAIFVVVIFQAARLRDGPSVILILTVLITVFSTTAGWWPRLAPQMWLAVCLVQLFVLVSVEGAVSRRVAHVVVAAMILNSALVFAGVFAYQRRASARFHRDLQDAKAHSQPVVVVDNRLGLVGFYNRRKLVDSLATNDQIVMECETLRKNRIFGICAERESLR
jgi:hypothetical protein